MKITTRLHKNVVVTPEGDYFQAACQGCDWKSELVETKALAREEHVAHLTEVLLKDVGRL